MSEYKRLTWKDEKGRWVAEAGFYGIYLDNVQPKRKDMIYGDVVNRLAELENKIESGELVEFPRKVLRGKDEIGENAYEVITTTSHLFYGERQADNFLEREKARLHKGASR